MKRFSLPLLGGLSALALLVGSCKKADEQPLTNAVIVSDPRTCATACCGGLVVNFTDAPTFFGDGAYSIVNYSDLHIASSDLPLYVRVNWVPVSSGSTSCRPTARIISLERR